MAVAGGAGVDRTLAAEEVDPEAVMVAAAADGGGGGGRPNTSAGGDATLQFQGAAAFSLVPDPEPVASADAALDGKITLPEFLGAVDRRFEAVDVKHRGSLSLTDLPKTPVQRGADPAHGGRGQ